MAFLSSLTVICCRPAEVLYPSNAGIQNVKTLYGAKGDGHTDDTNALLTAIRENVGQFGFGHLYFPSGIYIVSQQLPYITTSGWWGAYLTLEGENQSNTIIQLVDSAPGFQDSSHPTAVIYTASNTGNTDPTSPYFNADGGGNEAFRNHIMNLTVNTGSNNPGAIAIDYMANNNTRLSDVTLTSGDGGGVYGLNIQRGFPGPMLIKNLTVTGYATAIAVSNSYGVWIEHLIMSNQSTSGIDVINGSVSIRDLQSNNSVPGVRVPGWTGVLSLVDATFNGGSPLNSAIQLNAGWPGTVFLRNAVFQGYQSLVSNSGVPVAGVSSVEWDSTNPIAIFSASAPKSLNLPVQEPPTYSDTNFNNWAMVTDYGAQPNNPTVSLSTYDSYPGIQAAIDSGKPTICFPDGNYMISWYGCDSDPPER